MNEIKKAIELALSKITGSTIKKGDDDMNLLEEYLIEIISEEKFTINEKWAKGLIFVKAKIKTNCHGCIEIKETKFNKDEWLKYKETKVRLV